MGIKRILRDIQPKLEYITNSHLCVKEEKELKLEISKIRFKSLTVTVQNPISIKTFYEITAYCRIKVVCVSLEYGALIVILIFCHLEDEGIRPPHHVARYFYFPV